MRNPFSVCSERNYSTPESATPHLRSFGYYRLMKQDHTEVTDLLERIYASTDGSSFDDPKPSPYKKTFEELRGTSSRVILYSISFLYCMAKDVNELKILIQKYY